jgi:hypothetical protein
MALRSPVVCVAKDLERGTCPDMIGERGLGGDSVKGEDVLVDRWIAYGQCAPDNNLGDRTTQVDRMDIGHAGETA